MTVYAHDARDAARDRARGALLGLAAGDAVGTTVEFMRPGSFQPITDMVGGGPFRLEPGQWTDDTSMALCLAESLVERGGHDAADQMRRYCRWWQEGHLSPTGECFDIGTTTRLALARFARTGELYPATVDEEAAANGSLMRLAPVSIRWSHDPETVVQMAAESSRPTHPARRPVDACRVLAAMTAALIRGEPWEKVCAAAFWDGDELHPEIEAIARGSWRAKEPPAIRGTGFCVHALEAAIWAVNGAADFREAILRATNLGEDADTTAAIAGQLAGARFGAAGIPSTWLERLAMRELIVRLADALHEAAAGAGPRWPHDEAHHAWWADAEGRVLAGEFPAHRGDDENTLERLRLLAEAGIGTIIDLTEDRDGLTPYEPHLAEVTVAGRPMTRIRHPIRDVSVTTPEHYEEIVADIEKALASGERVYVHCWGGRGRTGTVIGCWHVSRGATTDEALRKIVAAREGTRKAHLPSPEVSSQIEAIREAERRRGSKRTGGSA